MTVRPGRLTLRARMALITALSCVLVAGLLSLGLYVGVQRIVEQGQLSRLQAAGAILKARTESGLMFGRLDLDRLFGSDVGQDIQLRVSVDEQVLAQSPQFPGALPADLAPGVYRSGGRYVQALTLDGRGGSALLTLSLDNRGDREAREAVLRALLLTLPLALLLALSASWWAAGRMLRPIAALERTAREIGESGDLTRPVPDAGDRDELTRLAATLQLTFEQLNLTRQREQQFLRSAAHDLRSPLAALQTRVSLALSRERDSARYRQDLQEVGHDLGRLARLAEHLLLLARNPQGLGQGPVPLLELAADAVDEARSRQPERDLDLYGTALTVAGDRVLLGQAVSNLLQNALRHAPGAAVTLSVRPDGSEALLTVQDDGPGVEPAVLARLGEAFYRPDAARSGEGYGLGLAIVRHVAQLHGGTLTLDSAPGAGFRATLRLPLTARTPEPHRPVS
ncbi:HAMP domain-containing sensor histidine kinase [Deinococcus sonorensis]|uniref:histidine kinase n=2 Tax=Deinococcus sonorensis TaxID=309891 RepID=A0AAU7UE06_9DEIO